MEPPGRSRRGVCLLILFWCGVVPLLAIWLGRDGVYAPWDSAHHVELTMRLRDGWARWNPWSFYELSKFYPPLFHALAWPASLLSDHPDAYAFGSWLGLLGLMIGTWLLGRTLCGATAGLAAGLLVGAYLLVTWMARQVMTDVVLAATVAVALWRSSVPDPLADRRSARLLGAAVALGMLAKWAFVLFVALPLAWRLSRLVARDPRPDRRRLLAVAAAWAIVPIVPWYARSLPDLVTRVGWHLGSGVRVAEGDPSPLSWASLLYYPQRIGEYYLTWPLCALLVTGIGFLAFALARGSCRVAPLERWMPSLLALVGGSVALVLISNKDARYVLPMVSVWAVVSTSWIALAGRWAPRAALAVAVLSYGTITWNLFWLAPPDPRDWRIEDAAAAIAQRMHDEGRAFRVLVVPNTWWTSWMTLHLAIANAVGGEGKVWVDRLEGAPDRESLSRYGTVVVVDPPPDEEAVSRGTKAAAAWILRESGWTPYAEFRRDDGRDLVLLAPPGRAPPLPEAPPPARASRLRMAPPAHINR